MKIKKINSESEYQEALNKFEELFDAESGTEVSDQADLLALVIEDYERRYHQIDAPDPISAIKIRLEDLNWSEKELYGVIGDRNQVSDILSRKRKLTLPMIRKLSGLLKIPVDTLIREYKLVDRPRKVKA